MKTVRWVSLICLVVAISWFLGSQIMRSSLQSDVEQEYGIKIQSLRLSAAGYMLDFRYKVLDPEKALPILDGKISPYLIDEATGAKFLVPAPPKIGALRNKVRNGLPEAGRTYFIMFGNPWQYVKAGNKVAVVVGDFKADNITVQ